MQITKKSIFNFIKNKDGLTLVEIIVTIMIFSIVVGVIFSFMQFGLDSFDLSVKKADEVADLRMTSLEVTAELRNVFTVDILTTNPTPPFNPTDQFIYMDSNDIILYDQGTSRVLSNSGLVDMNVNISVVNDKYVMNVSLDGEMSDFETDILLNNIQASDLGANISGGTTTGIAIEFSTTPN